MSEITIYIQTVSSPRLTIKVSAQARVAELKDKIKNLANVPVENQALLYSGKKLRDEDTLASQGLIFFF